MQALNDTGEKARVRRAPDRATPIRRTGQPTSYRHRGKSGSFTTRVLSGSLYLFDVAARRHYPPDLAESETFARALNQFESAIR